MRRRAKMFRPIADGLPTTCYAAHPTMEDIVIVLFRGECTYEFYDGPRYGQRREATIDALNDWLGVTPAQREAMLNGSLFGWNIPAANPEFWKEKV